MGPRSAFLQAVGLHLHDIGPTRVTGWVELGADHHGTAGIVHGGVYATVAETAAGLGATAAADPTAHIAVGVSNDTNFLRPVSSGRLSVVGEPIHQGRTQQLWEVRMVDEQGRLVATAQVRLQNIPAPKGSR